jgi:hypothetical protein
MYYGKTATVNGKLLALGFKPNKLLVGLRWLPIIFEIWKIYYF